MMTRPCDMLPPVRGSLTMGAALKDLVWFRAGGPAEILFRPADWYETNRIVLRSGLRVDAVDREKKTASLSNGETLAYDHLVFATGAKGLRGNKCFKEVVDLAIWCSSIRRGIHDVRY